ASASARRRAVFTTTSQPRAASASTMARPMLRPAPVTIAACPRRLAGGGTGWPPGRSQAGARDRPRGSRAGSYQTLLARERGGLGEAERVPQLNEGAWGKRNGSPSLCEAPRERGGLGEAERIPLTVRGPA